MVSAEFPASLGKILAGRIGRREIDQLCAWSCGKDGDELKAELFSFTQSADDRTAYNSLWVFTHFDDIDVRWLGSRRNQLIDGVLSARHVGRMRLSMALLDRLPAGTDALRTDFLDFCLSKINSSEPYAVRALALKLSCAMCEVCPSLKGELLAEIDLMSQGELSPGLLSSRRNVLKRLARL